jgi:membrane protease YdiL (CAAX protease family)
MSLFVGLFVFVFWSIYRLNFPENLLFDELFLKPLIWLAPVFVVVKTDFKSLGFSSNNIKKNMLIGLVVGLVLSFERIYVKHLSYQFSRIFVISAFFTAVTEEIFFRGFLLNRWLKHFKNPIIAMVLNGLFFSCFHLPIAIFVFHYYNYALFTYLLVNFVSGFVDIYLFYQTKSIYTSITNHFVWNTFSGLFR